VQRLEPASAAVPAAAEQQNNENNDDEKRGVIHVWPLARFCIRTAPVRHLKFSAFRTRWK